MAPSRGGTAQPVTILDVETTRPLPALTRPGPARLLIRVDHRPVAFEAVQVPETGWDATQLRGVVDRVLAEAGPTGTRAPRPVRATRPKVSVVVTTCQASASLVRVLYGLRAQTVAVEMIVVVDNRPGTSGVASMLASLGMPGVRLVEEERRGVSYARNAGLDAVDTEVVVFSDDDVVVDARWIETIQHAFADDPEIACVTGLVLPAELTTRAQLLFEEFGGYSKGYQRTVFRIEDRGDRGPLYPYAVGVFGTGANSSFRTEALRRLGGFDPALGAGTVARGGEDLDIHLDVIAEGYALAYEPAAIVWHNHHRTMPDLRRQLFDYGAGLSAMLTKRFLSRPAEAGAILLRAATGLRHLLSGKSPKNRRKSSRYPLHLTLIEIAGFAWGPFAFVCSKLVRAVRRPRSEGR